MHTHSWRVISSFCSVVIQFTPIYTNAKGQRGFKSIFLRLLTYPHCLFQAHSLIPGMLESPLWPLLSPSLDSLFPSSAVPILHGPNPLVFKTTFLLPVQVTACYCDPASTVSYHFILHLFPLPAKTRRDFLIVEECVEGLRRRKRLLQNVWPYGRISEKNQPHSSYKEESSDVVYKSISLLFLCFRYRF